MNSPLCVVCPVYNTPYAYLNELKNSLAEAGLRAGDSVVWIDDASQDPSGFHKIRAEMESHPEHRFLVLPKNKGVAHALNEGIRSCTHSYVITMGSDDVFLPDYFNRARALLDVNPARDVIVPSAELFEGKTGFLDPSEEDLRLKSLWSRNVVPAASMFRRTLWEKIGGFDEALSQNFEDWDFWFRARLVNARFERLGQPGYRYRVRAGLSAGIPFEQARRRLRMKWLPQLIFAGVSGRFSLRN